MDWQLRIALIIAGFALVGYVYYDYARKKKIQKENEKLKQQFSSISESVDSAGFDHVGVGSPRPATSSMNSDQIDSTKTPTNELKGTTVEKFIEQSLDKDMTVDGIDNDTIANDKIAVDNKVITEGEALSQASETNQGFAPEVTPNDISKDSESQDSETPEKAMVLSLILQAPQGSHFKGRDFLPLLLSQGLRHGEMGIFHRRARGGKEPGPVLFSLANGIAPGTFDINNMENFETPALACFVTLPGPDDAQVAYNAMYKTCLLLQQELGGDLLDESKSVYSKQTHNHRLDQVKDYSFKFGG